MTVAVLSAEDTPFATGLLRALRLCDRLVAADGGLRLLEGTGLVADLVVGDFDSLGPAYPWRPLAREAEVLDPAKDDSDTEAAVRRAREWGASRIWLVGGSGGRTDHWLSNLRLVARTPWIDRWLTPLEVIRRLSAGGEVAVAPGRFSVFPLGSGPWSASSSGARWPLERVDFERWHSLSNETVGEGARVVSARGEFLVLQDWTSEALL